MLKALIVDDEELARRGLEIRLEKFSDIDVCAQSRNGREALEDARKHSPDLMFLVRNIDRNDRAWAGQR